MIKEEFGYGNSVEEATAEAIKKLNAEDYKIDIIEDVKPKVLGLFGGHGAKVRAYVELPDPKPEKKSQPTGKQKSQKSEQKAKKSEPKAEKADNKAENVEEKQVFDYKPLDQIDDSSAAHRAGTYILGILTQLGVENASIKVAEIENGARLLIEGENLGIVIGRRGETLDALQYLASFSANVKNGSGYYRIVLDICNYREKREQTLKSLARRTAASAKKSGRNRSLEPMNPYERRIIHTEVQEIEGVSSHSVGEGMNRHVVITPDGARRNDYRRRGSRNGDSRQVNNVPTREPRSDAEDTAPLYGRIG